MGLGGAPALPSGSLLLENVHRSGGVVNAQVRLARAGTVRAYLWDGTTVLGALDATEHRGGNHRITVELAGKAADGATVRLVASLETANGTAAAASPVD